MKTKEVQFKVELKTTRPLGTLGNRLPLGFVLEREICKDEKEAAKAAKKMKLFLKYGYNTKLGIPKVDCNIDAKDLEIFVCMRMDEYRLYPLQPLTPNAKMHTMTNKQTMKVYLLMDWGDGPIVLDIFKTREAAERKIQEWKESGNDISEMKIEEREVVEQ